MAEAKDIFMVFAEYSLNTQTFDYSNCDDTYCTVPNTIKHGSNISI